ncbi:short neuropeptide F-like [Rhynchophorus ferrugineus]|nr:short neuropeptide F-like protein [Rhynchophorus ferrugineus]
MQFSSVMRFFAVVLSFMILLASVSPAPYFSDNESSIRELVEMLMQRERENSLEDSRVGYHQVSRKAGRSPQLRLRFGKRMDNAYPVSAYLSGLNDATTEN